FTLSRRPRGQGLLHFDLAVRGGLKPRVTKDAVSFVDANGAVVLSYGGLKAWGASGGVLAPRVGTGGGRVGVAGAVGGGRGSGGGGSDCPAGLPEGFQHGGG